MIRWPNEPILTLDLETTGPDPTKDLPVSIASIVIGEHLDAPQPNDGLYTLCRPGVPIPAEATAIHGITNEQVADLAVPPLDEAFSACLATLRIAEKNGWPVVIYNARYDWTILGRLAKQYGAELPKLAILDPFVIDRHFDKYRSGRRTLTATCEHYCVTLDGAHDARADSLAAARLMLVLADVYPSLRRKTPDGIHKATVGWFETWRLGFNEYLARKSDTPDFVTGKWPA